MSTINTNIPSLVSQRHLRVSQRDLGVSLERLASGLRINRGADDPAGLIVSERLRAEVHAVTQAIDNSLRASNVIATTEGALDEVSALLIDIQALIIEAANSGAFSDEETDANQLQIDSAIESITRIANTTTFAGRKLLNGGLDYITSGVVATDLANVNVFSAKFGTLTSIPVNINVTTSGRQAELAFAGSVTSSVAVTVNVEGPEGVVTLNFPASTTTTQMATDINAVSQDTGIIAVLSGPGTPPDGSQGVRLLSTAYGSKAFVSVTPLPGSAGLTLVDPLDGVVDTRATGVDAVATINGASSVADGLDLSLSTSLLKLEVTLQAAFGAGTTSFSITGGGALFQLGPRVGTNQQENIGVKAMQANKLGNVLVGFLSELKSGQKNALVTGNFKPASDIIDEVITQVAVLRGRLGAFERNTLQTNVNQLQITTENLTAAESAIRDTDFAVETTELTRSQILVQAGNSILAIANAQAQNVLTLLGG
ncbi:MAG: flagellin [Phycisphaerae bacterium]